MEPKEMKKGALYAGKLPDGCVYCEQGRKLVLLVTGLCGAGCFYCPLSDKKRGKDVVYANEKLVNAEEDIISEAESIDALGAGITGGDPLCVLERTTGYICLLKEHFGPKFHIHLYTGLPANAEQLKALEDAGLDELRFHPPPRFWANIKDSEYAGSIESALKTRMDIGVEVPALPDKRVEMERLLDYLATAKIKFVNLNELEFSETNWQALKRKGYKVKDDVSSGVAGSEEMARELVAKYAGQMAVHYCSGSFKDGVQLRNRLKRRAANVARKWDVITDDGTLVKGIIEGDYLEALARILEEEFDVPADMYWLDKKRDRIELAAWMLEEIAGSLDCDCFVIEEYPTADGLEVERRKL